MPEKESTFKLPIRLENTIKGFSEILISIILVLNAGKVARTVVFPLIYLFGISYYIFTLLLFARGVYRIIFGKKNKPLPALIIIGIIVIFLGAIITSSASIAYINGFNFADGLVNNLNRFHEELGNYYSPVFLNLFAPNTFLGAGLIAVLLSSLMGSNLISLIVGLLVIFIGILIMIAKPIIQKIIAYSKREKVAKPKPEKKKKVKVIKEPKEEVKKEPEPKPLPKEEIPEVLLEPEPETFSPQYGFEPDDSFGQSSDDFHDQVISLDESYGSGKIINDKYSDFAPLIFDNNSSEDPKANVVRNMDFEGPNKDKNEEIIASPIYEKKVDYFFKEEIEKPVNDKKEDVSDTLIDFNAPLDDISSFFGCKPNASVVEETKNEVIEEQKVEEVPQNISSRQEEAKDVNPVQRPLDNKTYEQVNNMMNSEIKPEPEKKKKERVIWNPPSSELLEVYETQQATETNSKVAEDRVNAINQVFIDFHVGAKCTSYTIGSSVTRYNIVYDANVSVKQVEKLVNDISIRLGGVNARFTPVVQGESFSGLEIPNVTITTVSFKEVFNALPSTNKHLLSVGFGKNISGDVVAADFDEFPHLLVAGTTGSGKSIYIHSIIATLIMRVSPDDLKIVLVDPKKVEMTKYRDMPHLLCPIITEADKAKVMLSKLVDEMNDRYERFAVADSCSNIKQFNEWAKENNQDTMPYIIVVLDEYADLVDTCKEISQPVVSIAQKARACGIHMLISTQRPSTNVITGVIKGNLPTHVALMTSSSTDSMTILGEGGAEKLLGKGDMLVQSPLVSRVGLTRLQGCFIQNKEIGRIVGYLKEHYETNYDENYLDLIDHSREVASQKIVTGEVEKEADATEEAKYQSIKEWVMTQQFVSMSKIQRECAVGFNRAGRFFNRLQKEGVVSTQQDGSTKGCKVLAHDDDDCDSIVTSDELIY